MLLRNFLGSACEKQHKYYVLTAIFTERMLRRVRLIEGRCSANEQLSFEIVYPTNKFVLLPDA